MTDRLTRRGLLGGLGKTMAGGVLGAPYVALHGGRPARTPLLGADLRHAVHALERTADHRPGESKSFSALTFFLDPVTVALNHAVTTRRPTSVQMIGLSGGGWTTTVYARRRTAARTDKKEVCIYLWG